MFLKFLLNGENNDNMINISKDLLSNGKQSVILNSQHFFELSFHSMAAFISKSASLAMFRKLILKFIRAVLNSLSLIFVTLSL